ncbi:hypothetical protein ACFYPT_11605 [Streptomyces sp. NPDC005529]|uniref:hypothetical protein n=1 Tax=unclassified Streptomyces TaxID=2593676 RepID=UPI0033A92E46
MSSLGGISLRSAVSFPFVLAREDEGELAAFLVDQAHGGMAVAAVIDASAETMIRRAGAMCWDR